MLASHPVGGQTGDVGMTGSQYREDSRPHGGFRIRDSSALPRSRSEAFCSRHRRQLVNRYYDPATEQFISVDPLVSATGQPFSYAGDDPVNGSDPIGLSPDKSARQQPKSFTDAEQTAWDECNAGNQAACRSDAYQRALDKSVTNGKYGYNPNGVGRLTDGNKPRNSQKRGYSPFQDILPSRGIFDLPPCPIVQTIGQGLQNAGQALSHYGTLGAIAGGGLIVIGGIALEL